MTEQTDETKMWGRVKANAYWGKRSGIVTKRGDLAYPQKRTGRMGDKHSGPAGWKLKKAKRGKI
jgi:hypothetical protein